MEAALFSIEGEENTESSNWESHDHAGKQIAEDIVAAVEIVSLMFYCHHFAAHEIVQNIACARWQAYEHRQDNCSDCDTHKSRRFIGETVDDGNASGDAIFSPING
jgi:hypothetical protein